MSSMATAPGRFTVADLASQNQARMRMPATGADGTITSVAVMKELRELCDAHDLALHVDGARHRPRRRPRAEHSAASLIARISGDAIGQIWDVADDLSGSADRQTPRPPARPAAPA